MNKLTPDEPDYTTNRHDELIANAIIISTEILDRIPPSEQIRTKTITDEARGIPL